MTEEKQSYQKVMKATSLFGGVQVLQILIAIARGKVLAMLLGPEGTGISNLLIRPLQLITAATNLGLDQSAVKEISAKHAEGNEDATSRTIAILKQLVWVTATVGAVIMAIFSPLLSEITFNSQEYTWSFVWLGLALVFNQLAMSRIAILQGLRKLAFLAKANLYGALAGLIVTVPLYYFFKFDGILPAIVATAGFLFFFAHYFARKEIKKYPAVSTKTAFGEGKEMIRLGLSMSVSGIIGLLVAYLILVYVRMQGGELEAGYYAAGIVILNSYVGLIFNAMATDYFPRLSAICADKKATAQTVFEQAFIGVLLITPIIVAFVAFAPIIIPLLYSGEFDNSVALVRWGILGMVFKAASWSMGYVILAKGDSSLFMKTAIGFNSLLLVLNVVGYQLYGLEGIGMSMLLYLMIHFIAVRIIVFYRYDFRMPKGFYPIFMVCLMFCGAAFGATYIETPLLKYGVLALLIGISSLYSFRRLDAKIGFKTLIASILKKKKQ